MQWQLNTQESLHASQAIYNSTLSLPADFNHLVS